MTTADMTTTHDQLGSGLTDMMPMHVEEQCARVERWRRAAEWPLTIAALAFLAAYAWPILQPTMSRQQLDVTRLVTVVTWSMFAGDYAVRTWLSPDRLDYVRRHLLDLVIVAVPLLRPLRLLRLLTLLAFLNRHAGRSLRGHVVTYVAGSTVLISVVGALAVLDAERYASDANITTPADAAWWTLTTITTVGYGDRYPVTGTGRLVALGLMVAGIALLGVVTAALASWLVQRVAEADDEAEATTQAQVAALAAEVRALREELARGALAVPQQAAAKAPRARR